MKKGLKEKREAEVLLTKIFDNEMRGRDTSALYKKLDNNLYYQMDKNGMAVTVMNNVLDTPNRTVRFTDKAVKQAMNNMTGSDKAFNTLSSAYLSPTANTGRIAMQIFGSIDGMSRYSMAYNELLKSTGGKAPTLKNFSKKDLDVAITKVNGIYGDMDMIAPVWSQAIQQYGFIPFSNWYFRVAGGMNMSIKKNAMRAIGIYALLEYMSEEGNVRTDSMNPLATAYKTPIDMMMLSPYTDSLRTLKSTFVPSVYKKSYYAAKFNEPSSIILTENF
jgi:hypothetical protein